MDTFSELAFNDTVLTWLKAILVLGVGTIVARLLAKLVHRAVSDFMDAAAAATLRRFVLYGLFGIVVMTTLNQLGFNIGVLLGAAGILTVAIGFASQTSAANVVSGLFLVFERAFTVGDVIQVGATTGEVLSIDLLSVKVRTFDNLFVRIPNESLIKSEIKNLSRFPIRRYDMQVGVAYKEDIKRVGELLIATADEFELCLDHPRPVVIFQGFGESSINLQFSVWAARENWLPVRNGLPARVKQAFDKAGIEIPFPQRTLSLGEAEKKAVRSNLRRSS